ncbi:MAG TPA: cytochrome c-type biogenesis protein CcmH [Alphaproteobacteria bacterium]|nr:cytochrome c-type biogenesis protein CcmH [Alphaproteobacteria bacterium]
MKRTAQVLILALVSLLLSGADTDKRYNAVGGKIMCTCGCGQMLLKCNHVGCQNSATMIRQLRDNLQTTQNDEDVLNWFRRTWGTTTVVEPATHGLELWAWIMPFAALLLGFILVVFLLRSWQSRPQAAGANISLDPALETFRSRARRETEE